MTEGAEMTTSKDIRDDFIDALRLDLVGPRPGHGPHAEYAEEVLPIAPSIANRGDDEC